MSHDLIQPHAAVVGVGRIHSLLAGHTKPLHGSGAEMRNKELLIYLFTNKNTHSLALRMMFLSKCVR